MQLLILSLKPTRMSQDGIYCFQNYCHSKLNNYFTNFSLNHNKSNNADLFFIQVLKATIVNSKKKYSKKIVIFHKANKIEKKKKENRIYLNYLILSP